jgi:integrase
MWGKHYIWGNKLLIMATVKFLTKGKSNPQTIYLRLRNGRSIDLTVSTGYTIKPEFWSSAKGEPKQTASNKDKVNLSNDLRKLKDFVHDKLNEFNGSDISINKEWLSHVVELCKNPSLDSEFRLVNEMIDEYKEKLKYRINPKTGKPTSHLTIKNFNTTQMRLTKFEEYRKHKFQVHEIDLTFHTEYFKFAEKNLGLSVNSIGKDLRQIKTICLDARDNGIKINSQVESRKFNAPSEPTIFVTLSETEIQSIKDHEFKQDYLRNAKDWLIIGCWTGCRVNDLMKLNKNNILMNPKGQRFIRYVQSKTGKQVDLPIHPHVDEILERLGDFPRAISDVKFNEYIKTVCKESGLTQLVKGTRQNPKTHKKETGLFEKWQLVKSHTCRRSFATNHFNKLSNKLIMRVTGHATERMLLQYIGETENDHLEDFMNVWGSDTNEEKKIVKMA